MPTNLHLDDAALAELLALGGFKTKREAVDTAIREHLLYLKRVRTLEAIGTIDFDPNWDYKADRRRRTEKLVRMGIWPKTALHPRKPRKATKKVTGQKP